VPCLESDATTGTQELANISAEDIMQFGLTFWAVSAVELDLFTKLPILLSLVGTRQVPGHSTFALSLLWLIAPSAHFVARGPYAKAARERLGGSDNGLGRNELPIRAPSRQFGQ
jgi:hypothetical protein